MDLNPHFPSFLESTPGFVGHREAVLGTCSLLLAPPPFRWLYPVYVGGPLNLILGPGVHSHGHSLSLGSAAGSPPIPSDALPPAIHTDQADVLRPALLLAPLSPHRSDSSSGFEPGFPSFPTASPAVCPFLQCIPSRKRLLSPNRYGNTSTDSLMPLQHNPFF